MGRATATMQERLGAVISTTLAADASNQPPGPPRSDALAGHLEAIAEEAER
jgi:hypothetical protein